MTDAPLPLRVLLVDDEPLARARLRLLLQEQREPAALVVAEAGTADEALAWLKTETRAAPDAAACDTVLLDIRMPGRDGLQLAAALQQMVHPPAVVFVTAHGHHALRAFELDAVDYLTKPVQRSRLQAALQRVVARRRGSPSGFGALGEAPMLVVVERGRVLRIPVDEVLVLKAEMKYVTLRTATRSHVVDDSLTELEQRLGPSFVRVHRSALVARRALRELARRPAEGEDGADDGWAVRVAPIDEWLPVSRRQLAAVREAMG